MKSRELAVAAAVLLCLTACTSDDTTAPTTTSTNTTPVTPVESPTASSPTPETSAESTAPLSTAPMTAAPATDPVEAATLRQIVQPYETRGSEGGFAEYAIESCYTRPKDEQPPFETPFVSDPVPLDTTVQRGDVFLCTIRTEPPADVGDLGLIVLDDIGTTAAWGGSDYPEMPFVTAPGLLCREFLADPWLGKPIDAYTLVLAYWFLEGQPARMDVDGNGIPCELLFDPVRVAQVWAGENP